jgi:hypothetical protein
LQKSRASWALRRALKRRTRRWRRRQVFFFYLSILGILAVTLGNDHRSFPRFLYAAVPILVFILAPLRRSRDRQRLVKSLDDRAQMERGINFDQLPPAAQKDTLARHRPLGAMPDSVCDERQEMSRLRAGDAAFRFLRKALAGFAAAYWMVYLWVPSGDVRQMLMDSPVLISWLIVFVTSLPQVIEMWNEPDDSGEAAIAGFQPRETGG